MLRCNDDKSRKLRFPLGDGDVLFMSGTTQVRIDMVVTTQLHRSASCVLTLLATAADNIGVSLTSTRLRRVLGTQHSIDCVHVCMVRV